MTSGRSGLASAVIYQPSSHNSYANDCIRNFTSNRDYDDEKRPHDNQDDESDMTSKGASSSYQFDCPPNFFNNREGGPFEENSLSDSDISTIKFHNLLNLPNVSSKGTQLDLLQEFRCLDLIDIVRLKARCQNHSLFPIRAVKRQFKHFIFNSKAVGSK